MQLTGDRPDVLVVMNPAALKSNVADVPHGGILIINTDEFTKRNLSKVGYESNPLEDGSPEPYQVYEVGMSTLTQGALADTGLGKKDAERCKTCSRSGCCPGLYHRPTESTERFLAEKFVSCDVQAGWLRCCDDTVWGRGWVKASRCGVELSSNRFTLREAFVSHATHANAALTPRARVRLARLIVDGGWPIGRAAERYDVCWRTAKK
ncbi:2-oxoacid:acceptor oxidoreductase family protein, partial [Haloechinothrix alba]